MLEVVKSAIDSVDEIDGHIGRCIARRREFLNITYVKTFAGRVGGFVGLVARFEASERRVDPGMLLDI